MQKAQIKSVAEEIETITGTLNDQLEAFGTGDKTNEQVVKRFRGETQQAEESKDSLKAQA